MNNVETAFRIAGHVVMAMLWGVWRADKVSMAGMDDVGGGIGYGLVPETEGKEARDRFGTRLSDARLESMMGGPVAQAILLGREVVYQGGMPSRGPAEAWKAIQVHEPIVQADLKRMWPVVEAIAQELMRNEELTDHEIRSVVRTAVNKLPENERAWAISRLRNAPPNSFVVRP